MKKTMRPVSLMIAAVLLFCGLAQAQTGCPDLSMSTVWQAYEGPMALLVMPDGSGSPMTEATLSGGAIIDATIYLTLYGGCDNYGVLLADFPAEDMWLESTSGSLVFCVGGSIADGPTDQEGNTTWSRPLMGGGWDLGTCRVMVTGDSGIAAATLLLQFNSPDLNGDLKVDLTDVTGFAEDFFSHTYNFRSDLAFDSVVNLSDITVMRAGMGKSCP